MQSMGIGWNSTTAGFGAQIFPKGEILLGPITTEIRTIDHRSRIDYTSLSEFFEQGKHDPSKDEQTRLSIKCLNQAIFNRQRSIIILQHP